MQPVYSAKNRISERESRSMIVAMAKYGNHYNDPTNSLRTTANIKEHFSQAGLDFKECIRECRDFGKSVPMYENLIGPTWTTKGAAVSRLDHISGEYAPLVSGDGTYNESDYWAAFDIAKEDFEQSLLTGQYERFLAALNAGLASLESFLNRQYMLRLKRDNADSELKQDLDWKIDN